MQIKFQFPRILWKSTTAEQGERDLHVSGGTVADLLREVQRLEPQLYRCICDETGRLRQHLNLFINDTLLDRNQLQTRLCSGDVVQVFQAVSGG